MMQSCSNSGEGREIAVLVGNFVNSHYTRPFRQKFKKKCAVYQILEKGKAHDCTKMEREY